jgi:hypothetical protein
MIRNVVLVRLKVAHDAAEVKEIQQGFLSLGCPGTVSYQDARHNELRDRLRPMAEQIARVQFEVPS